MLVWLFALVTLLLVTPVLFALAQLAKRLSRQQRQGFARRAAQHFPRSAQQRPAPVSVNSVWGVDLTFVRDHFGAPRPVLGVVDHSSRVCTRLAAVVNKRSWTLICHLCLAIGQYGKPHAIRTDNELVFKSAAFKTFLKLVGIRHQRIPVCAPWCNGQIESFFGRIKPFIGQIQIHSPAGLQNALEEIRHFFNHVRTHQNLAGLNPAEAWAGLTPTGGFRK